MKNQKKQIHFGTVLDPIQFVHLLTVILGEAHLAMVGWWDGQSGLRDLAPIPGYISVTEIDKSST